MSSDEEAPPSKKWKRSATDSRIQEFCLRNTQLQSNSPGLIFRRSMNWWDRHPKDRFVSWDESIRGIVKQNPSSGDYWVDVNGGYLPIIKWGSRLLFPASGEAGLAGEIGTASTDGFLDRTQQNKLDGILGPMMPPKDAEIFSKLLTSSTSLLEFGCGGSTVHALTYPNIDRIFSVESDSQWLDALRGRQDVSEAIACDRLELVHIDIGPVVRTGWPKDESAKERWPRYSGAAAAVERTFDLVLVDGRFRTACFLKALHRILSDRQGKAVLAMHNFYSSGEREVRYPAILKFVETLSEFDYGETIGVFRPKAEIDLEALAASSGNFEYDPR